MAILIPTVPLFDFLLCDPLLCDPYCATPYQILMSNRFSFLCFSRQPLRCTTFCCASSLLCDPPYQIPAEAIGFLFVCFSRRPLRCTTSCCPWPCVTRWCRRETRRMRAKSTTRLLLQVLTVFPGIEFAKTASQAPYKTTVGSGLYSRSHQPGLLFPFKLNTRLE